MHRTLAVLIVLLGAGLRITNLTAQSLWNDEAITVMRAANIAAPGTYAPAPDLEARHMAATLLTVPFVVGLPGELGARWLPALVSVILVAAAYRLGTRTSEGAGLLAAQLTALYPFHLHYAQEARQYALLAVLGVLALLLLNTRGVWAILIAMPLLHAVAALYAWVICGLLALRGAWRAAVLGGVGVTAVTAAIFLVEQRGTYLAWAAPPSLADIGDLAALAAGVRMPLGPPLAIAPLGIAAAGVALTAGLTTSERLPLGASALLPPLGLAAASYLIRPVWAVRYLAPSLAAAVVLIAVGAASIRPGAVRALLSVTLIAVMGWAALRYHYHTGDAHHKPAYREAYTHITEHAQPGDVVVADLRPPAAVYLRGTGLEVRIPAVRLGQAARLPLDLEAELLAETGRAWLVWLGDDPPQRFREELPVTAEEHFGGLTVLLVEASE